MGNLVDISLIKFCYNIVIVVLIVTTPNYGIMAYFNDTQIDADLYLLSVEVHVYINV